MSKTNKVVVVTGCSSGFGEGAVKAFADKGYRVWGTLRDAQGRNAGKKAALEAYSSQVSAPSPPRGQPKKQRTEEAAPKSKATIEPAAQPAKKRYAVDQEPAQETNGEEAPTMPSTPAARAAGSPRIAAPLLAAVKALVAPAPAPVIPRVPHLANIRRRVTRFTAEEERALREGVREYGKGSWAQILFAKHSVFSQNNRTQVDLKDKWRNIEMKDKRARQNLERDALAAA